MNGFSYSQLIAPCPEAMYLMVLNFWWPGLGIACTSYYGRKGCSMWIGGLGGVVMTVAFLTECFNWAAFIAGWFGLWLGSLGFSGAVFLWVFYALCLGWVLWILGKIFMILLFSYTTVHMWFSVFAYTDMIVKNCNWMSVVNAVWLNQLAFLIKSNCFHFLFFI